MDEPDKRRALLRQISEPADDPDAFQFGRAKIGRQKLSFYVEFNPEQIDLGSGGDSMPTREDDSEAWARWTARAALAYADAYESALAAIAPGLETRVEARIHGPDTGGPGIGGEFVRFFVGDDPLGRLADALAVLGGIRAVYRWLRDRSGQPVSVSDGVAALVAADALESVPDVTLVFCQPVTTQDDEGFPRVEGFVVALRDTADYAQVYEVLVGCHGAVIRIDSYRLEGLDSEPPPPSQTRPARTLPARRDALTPTDGGPGGKPRRSVRAKG